MRPSDITERKRKQIGREIKAQLVSVARPADVARMLGISKEMVNHITDRALYKVATRMRAL